MHPEMDGSLPIDRIHGWLAQRDVAFSGTQIASGGAGQAKQQGMAEVAATLDVCRRQIDDILNHPGWWFFALPL